MTGTRGNETGTLAKLRAQETPNEPGASDLAPPDHLDAEAKLFWERHAEHLAANGLLTDADKDSFALLCRLWSALRQTTDRIGLVQLSKQFRDYARAFGMFPLDRKKAHTIVERFSDKTEFEF